VNPAPSPWATVLLHAKRHTDLTRPDTGLVRLRRLRSRMDLHRAAFDLLLAYTMSRASDVRTAKLFQNGRSQAVRIPKEFRLEGREVTIRKLGRGLVIEPVSAAWPPGYFDRLRALKRTSLGLKRPPDPLPTPLDWDPDE
jgi:virulence-associated protein VagC